MLKEHALGGGGEEFIDHVLGEGVEVLNEHVLGEREVGIIELVLGEGVEVLNEHVLGGIVESVRGGGGGRGVKCACPGGE